MNIVESNARIGRVSVSEELLRASINTGIAARVFYGSVPLEISRDWFAGTSTYILWHPKFDPVAENAKVPNYTAIVENGVISWEKCGYEKDAPLVTAQMLVRMGEQQ